MVHRQQFTVKLPLTTSGQNRVLISQQTNNCVGIINRYTVMWDGRHIAELMIMQDWVCLYGLLLKCGNMYCSYSMYYICIVFHTLCIMFLICLKRLEMVTEVTCNSQPFWCRDTTTNFGGTLNYWSLKNVPLSFVWSEKTTSKHNELLDLAQTVLTWGRNLTIISVNLLLIKQIWSFCL